MATSLKNCALIDCDTREHVPGFPGVPWGPDGEHWTGVAQVQRGNRIASTQISLDSITQAPGGAV